MTPREKLRKLLDLNLENLSKYSENIDNGNKIFEALKSNEPTDEPSLIVYYLYTLYIQFSFDEPLEWCDHQFALPNDCDENMTIVIDFCNYLSKNYIENINSMITKFNGIKSFHEKTLKSYRFMGDNISRSYLYKILNSWDYNNISIKPFIDNCSSFLFAKCHNQAIKKSDSEICQKFRKIYDEQNKLLKRLPGNITSNYKKYRELIEMELSEVMEHDSITKEGLDFITDVLFNSDLNKTVSIMEDLDDYNISDADLVNIFFRNSIKHFSFFKTKKMGYYLIYDFLLLMDVQGLMDYNDWKIQYNDNPILSPGYNKHRENTLIRWEL